MGHRGTIYLSSTYAYNVGALNIRLAGGSTGFEGRVEHYYAGSWGTVCDTGWDLNNAKVVCRQLGLGEAVRATTGTSFGRGTGGTVLSNVDCTGNETALGWCLHSGWNSRSCSQTAGVVCEGIVMQLSISAGLSFQFQCRSFITSSACRSTTVH